MIVKRYNREDEQFFRQVVIPEEDRHRFTSSPWRGEFRWFRSANIVPIEHWRRVEDSGEGRPLAAWASSQIRRKIPAVNRTGQV